ncbi:HK97-gp10 family putative phage morphogenesis protein [Paraburkholderia sp. J8-2]|uniref:HK97-gp10 family putative phage morphogenesis protein n=1 Tax=Paraburkholderia sp. J8-2 TaxID=2805440 RepID=UPI002AB6DA60|nr:HK97-gp10 family putative phage morphogenesis protein [Paraburkholderia sp. J8-2]
MSKPVISIQNPDGFSDFLKRMGDAFGESALRKAGAAAASVVLKEAQYRAPIGPMNHHQGSKQYPVGFGAEALLVAYIPEKSVAARMATYRVTWSAEAYYLRFYEYGTSRMAARPFFRPAIEVTKQAQIDAIRTQINQSLTEAGIV